MALDTTGESLHKRSYRTLTSKAPITETLAAALIMLTRGRATGSSWTRSAEAAPSHPEAAMIAANMAPGMNREFLSRGLEAPDPQKMLV